MRWRLHQRVVTPDGVGFVREVRTTLAHGVQVLVSLPGSDGRWWAEHQVREADR